MFNNSLHLCKRETKKTGIHCFVLQKTKFKVKFEKGTRGLLSSNHISLESNPNPAVLNVGSRVVGKFRAFSVHTAKLFMLSNKA